MLCSMLFQIFFYYIICICFSFGDATLRRTLTDEKPETSSQARFLGKKNLQSYSIPAQSTTNIYFRKTSAPATISGIPTSTGVTFSTGGLQGMTMTPNTAINPSLNTPLVPTLTNPTYPTLTNPTYPTLTNPTYPTVTNPIVSHPITTLPAYPVTSPVVSNPVTLPMVTQPMVTQPMVTQPMVTQPMVTQPMVSQPMVSKSITYPEVTLQSSKMSTYPATNTVTYLTTNGKAYPTIQNGMYPTIQNGMYHTIQNGMYPAAVQGNMFPTLHTGMYPSVQGKTVITNQPASKAVTLPMQIHPITTSKGVQTLPAKNTIIQAIPSGGTSKLNKLAMTAGFASMDTAFVA